MLLRLGTARAGSGLLLAPFRGSSDPFSATAVSLTPQEHDVITQAGHFFVFVAQPDKKSTVWRAPIADTSSHISLRYSIEDEAEVHAILAAGYAVVAQNSKHGRAQPLSRTLYHKTKAVELLREKLVNHGFSQNITDLIRLLISLDFEASNDEAALVHLRGLWAMTSTTPGIFTDAQQLLRISDVWIAINLLKKPEISPTHYDPGERSLQQFDRILVELTREHGSLEQHESQKSIRVQSALHGRTWALLEAAQEIVDTRDLMDKIDDTCLLQDVVQWMSKRSTAVCGYCTTGYVEYTEAAAARSVKDEDRNTRTLMAAACICAIMLMNFRFLHLPTNHDFSRTCPKIERVLQSLSRPLNESKHEQQNNDYLWLLFLTTMGNDIYAAQCNITYWPWPAIEFHRTCERLSLTEESDIVELLGKYPHYVQMDAFLLRLLSQKTATTNIFSWSEWRGILGHD